MKMTKKKIFLFTSVIIGTTIFISSSHMIGKLVYDTSIGLSQKINNEDMIAVYSKRSGNPLEKLNYYNHQKLMVKSEINNYDIDTLVIKSPKDTDNTMIIVHGIQSNYNELLDIAFEYLDNGYNVVLYNQRNTGLTGGDTYTFGRYERYDLDSIVTYTKSIFPTGSLGVHGFSMGASTSAMHSRINEKHRLVDYYILDSPYSKMEDSIQLGILDVGIPESLTGIVSFLGNHYTKLKEGFEYKDVKPVNDVKNINTPVMLIHGTSDDICSPDNSQEIYDAIPHNNKELWFVEGIEHTQAFSNNTELYMNKIFTFIENYKDK
ncbi:MAG: alpha/beta hydrolase [Sarcina sp.]